MMYVVAAVIGLHGIVHGLGFVSGWQLGTAMPLMSPTLLRADPDSVLMRALGLLWLVPVAGFVFSAIGMALELPVRPILLASALLSLGLCVIWWGDAKAGAVVDVAILLALVGTAWTVQLKTL